MLVLDTAAKTGRSVAPRWVPLAGDALLDRLRATGRPRPLADPDLVQRLQDILDQGFDPVVGQSVGPGAEPALDAGAPMVVTKDLLTRALCGEICGGFGGGGFGERAPTTAMACGALVDALFCQLVTVGTVGDPMSDGLAALSVDPRQASLVAWIGRLSGTERGALAAEVGRQAAGLVERWPVLDPGWLPRTRESIRAGVAGGAAELSARVDLAIGRPATDEASVALVELTAGARRPEHRHDRHFDALIETLRSSVPPFVVATYYSRTGELDVDPVDEELLTASARRTVAGIRSWCRPPGGGTHPGTDGARSDGGRGARSGGSRVRP